MKRQTILIASFVIVLLFSVFVYATTHIDDKDLTVEISKSAKQQLDSMDLLNLNHSELTCGVVFCNFSMWKEETRDSPKYFLGNNHNVLRRTCINASEEFGDCFEYRNNTDLELENLMTEKIVTVLERYADVFRERDTRAIDNIKVDRIGRGRITVNERK